MIFPHGEKPGTDSKSSCKQPLKNDEKNGKLLSRFFILEHNYSACSDRLPADFSGPAQCFS